MRFIFLFASNIFFFNLFGSFSRYGYFAFLFWADVVLLIASYMVLLPPALRSLREPRIA